MTSYKIIQCTLRVEAVTGLPSGLIDPCLKMYVTGCGTIDGLCIPTEMVREGAGVVLNFQAPVSPEWASSLKLLHVILASKTTTVTSQQALLPQGASAVLAHELPRHREMKILHVNSSTVAVLKGIKLEGSPEVFANPGFAQLEKFHGAIESMREVRERSEAAVTALMRRGAADPKEAEIHLDGMTAMGMIRELPHFGVVLVDPGPPATDACILHQLSVVCSRHPGWSVDRFCALMDTVNTEKFTREDAALLATIASEVASLVSVSVGYAMDNMVAPHGQPCDEYTWPIDYGGDCEDMSKRNVLMWGHMARFGGEGRQGDSAPLRALGAIARRYIPGFSKETVTAPSAAGGTGVKEAARAAALFAGDMLGVLDGVGAPVETLQKHKPGEAFSGHAAGRALRGDVFEGMVAGAGLEPVRLATFLAPFKGEVAKGGGGEGGKGIDLWPESLQLEGTGPIQPVLLVGGAGEHPHEALGANPRVALGGATVKQAKMELMAASPAFFDGFARGGLALGAEFYVGMLQFYPLGGSEILRVPQFMYMFDGKQAGVRHAVFVAAPKRVSLQPVVTLSEEESAAAKLIADHANVPECRLTAPGEGLPKTRLVAGTESFVPFSPSTSASTDRVVDQEALYGRVMTSLSALLPVQPPPPSTSLSGYAIIPMYISASDVTAECLAELKKALSKFSGDSLAGVTLERTPISDMHPLITLKFYKKLGVPSGTGTTAARSSAVPFVLRR